MQKAWTYYCLGYNMDKIHQSAASLLPDDNRCAVIYKHPKNPTSQLAHTADSISFNFVFSLSFSTRWRFSLQQLYGCAHRRCSIIRRCTATENKPFRSFLFLGGIPIDWFLPPCADLPRALTLFTRALPWLVAASEKWRRACVQLPLSKMKTLVLLSGGRGRKDPEEMLYFFFAGVRRGEVTGAPALLRPCSSVRN